MDLADQAHSNAPPYPIDYTVGSPDFDPPAFSITVGEDDTLQWDPPAGSKDLAVALSYHFPRAKSLEDKMQAALRRYLRASRNNVPQIASSVPLGKRSSEVGAIHGKMSSHASRMLPAANPMPAVNKDDGLKSSRHIWKAATGKEVYRHERKKWQYTKDARAKIDRNWERACENHRQRKRKCNPAKCRENKQHESNKHPSCQDSFDGYPRDTDKNGNGDHNPLGPFSTDASATTLPATRGNSLHGSIDNAALRNTRCKAPSGSRLGSPDFGLCLNYEDNFDPNISWASIGNIDVGWDIDWGNLAQSGLNTAAGLSESNTRNDATESHAISNLLAELPSDTNTATGVTPVLPIDYELHQHGDDESADGSSYILGSTERVIPIQIESTATPMLLGYIGHGSGGGGGGGRRYKSSSKISNNFPQNKSGSSREIQASYECEYWRNEPRGPEGMFGSFQMPSGGYSPGCLDWLMGCMNLSDFEYGAFFYF